jgi:NSS family neurotransmitter:Na+ symporter
VTAVPSGRETFASRLGMVAVMIGLAAGLGNVWRFPYMVGRFGGAAFVLFYVGTALLIGIPALMAEWSLGRHTRRGPVGAFERAGARRGREVGWILFTGMAFATAYYSNAIGWVLFHGVAEIGRLFGADLRPSRILPPASGLDLTSLGLQLMCTAFVLLACAAVLLRGLRSGIEPASRILTPLLFVSLLIILVRSVTLPGAWEGVVWMLRFDPGSLTAAGAAAAMSQMVFSLGLGGTMMVVYGSYLAESESLEGSAVWTVIGDTGAGLLAGLALFPAVFALGLEPSSGPGLLFSTLPGVFGAMPGGAVFGALFFLSLGGAAYLSGIAALEVLVAGLVDNTALTRKRATWVVSGIVFLLAIPPMLSMRIFVPWDLTFGSGFQTVGALAAALALGWVLDRSAALKQLTHGSPVRTRLLYGWVRWVIPGIILVVGVWWALTDLLGVVDATRAP